MDPSLLPDLERFSMQVTVYFAPSDLPKFWEAFKPIFDVVVNEPKIVYFEVFEDPAEPGKVSWIENWDGSPKWFMTEFMPSRMEYYKPYLEATEPLFVKPREFSIKKRVGLPYVVQKEGNLK
ncbi:uncharacterized protein LTR77_000477 [Saxophila tyrrhenica]|uniref:ABM domain-containing protein n=1 Tax=Saxophila tyrrhenica TaxID=1690608 RepID=A0AAV9PMS5_9PEZI|nr:hypothetical protein LTR77_000477 [Saxophila tyrrhenica]